MRPEDPYIAQLPVTWNEDTGEELEVRDASEDLPAQHRGRGRARAVPADPVNPPEKPRQLIIEIKTLMRANSALSFLEFVSLLSA